MSIVEKIFGTHSERELKRLYPLVDKVESYRDSFRKLSDEELKAKTGEFKARLAKGEDLETAVLYAKNYISGALAAMLDLGKGSGPMNHAFAIDGSYKEGPQDGE